MYSEDPYIGCPKGLSKLRAITDSLNAQVMEQVNECQELVMLNNFAKETNETHFKKCIQQRISDIASWRWVLEDLGKRLDEAMGTLQYEENALRVVVTRIEKEIQEQSQDATKPGALCPLSDPVEEAIIQEFRFLREQKLKFEAFITEVQKQIKKIEKTKSQIAADILNKQEALSVEQSCASLNSNCYTLCKSTCKEKGKKKKKRTSTVTRWENRCICLKTAGLKALSGALVTRQQVRGARAHLSVTAQTYAARVDSAIRRRLHTNKIKVQDLLWQKEEAIRDYKTLDEELGATEKNVFETIEQEQTIESKIADRAQRPFKEMTRDEVDKQLRDELGRLRCFRKQLQKNINRIIGLQRELLDSITRIDCFSLDIEKIIILDDERLRARLGDDYDRSSANTETIFISSSSQAGTSITNTSSYLSVIKEENNESEEYSNE